MKQIPLRISIISLIIITFYLGGCNKDEIFEELSISPSQRSLLGFYTSAENANSAVIGAYGYLSAARNLGASGTGMWLLRSDEVTGTSDYGVPGQYNDRYTPSWYSVTQPWDLMYVTAFAGTDIITNVPTIEFKNETLKDAYIGEAHCLRAFAHFFLLANYRNIILHEELPIGREEYTKSQVPPIEAWNLIIQDLEQAKILLPNKDYWDSSNKGRFTAGSAAGLLGKVYLYMTGIENNYGDGGINYYNEAADEFNDIITGKYGNYSLIDNYEENFGPINENNDESILEIQFVGDVVNTGFNPGSATSGLFNDNRGFSPPGLDCSACESAIHDWVYDAFVQSVDNDGMTDRRMFGTLIFNDLAPEINIPDLNNDGDFTNDRLTGVAGLTWEEMYPTFSFDGVTYEGFATKSTSFNNFKAASRKWLDLTLPEAEASGMQFNNSRAQGANWRFIRYADILLMYAEAVIMGGNQGSLSTLDAVNLVRARANVPPISTVGMAEIKTERVLELTMEGRFFDLLRWGELTSRFRELEASDPNFKGATTYDGFIENKHEWLPIPIDEIESNPKITNNNPGW